MPAQTLSVTQQVAHLARGCVDFHAPADLERKLARSASSGTPLRIKAGFDPSSPNIHIGHLVLMRKMKAFQELGHEVHFVVGDFTAMIGDPSGRSKTRPQLTREQVVANAETYRRQAVKVLDPDRTTLDFNGTWLAALGAEGLVRLAAQVTVAHILERNDFKERLEAQAPISVHELLYPICQGYDSVALRADVELGGTDQLFNLLMGRELMAKRELEPQVVMTTPLLEGLDGSLKMSKSLGNTVDIEDAPREMFGKLMRITDEMMWRYRELLTDDGAEAIAARRARVAAATSHPMDEKKDLAETIAREIHGGAAAREAREAFEQQFQRREVPADMPEIELARASLPVELVGLMVGKGLAASKSEARRLISQGAVDLGDARVSDPKAAIGADVADAILLKVGKRGYLRVRVVP
ncbi:MAG: tyrosine--tRNA ligase [Acidobacteriota bacterium]